MRPAPISPGHRASLHKRDAAPPAGLPRDLHTATATLLARLTDLQAAFYAEATRSLLIIIQGRDASGKDATIKAVCGAFNPQGCDVRSFKAPTSTELAHDYLWRAHHVVPPRRMIGVFNRSHYEDVLIGRVEKLATRAVWSKRFQQINDFERMLTECGTTIVKVCLHVSKGEQKRRLLERLADPKKGWKFSEDDLRARARWDDYTAAYRDMLSRCSTSWAPWYVIPADDKHARNYLVASVLTATLERLHPRYPVLSHRIARRMKALV
jgi:PPK2 family polyphosphate:nucleotide phosphotransferase